MMEQLLSLAQKVSARFPSFYLAGGTALMFKYEHRQSIDLDFFKKASFSFRYLSKKAREGFTVDQESEGDDNLDLFIEGTKVSFVFFPFDHVEDPDTWKGISIASDRDIFLNKVYAGGRRIDWKDPYDAAFLFERNDWEMTDLKRDFQAKFPDQSFEIHLGALASFEDYPELPDWVRHRIRDLLGELKEG